MKYILLMGLLLGAVTCSDAGSKTFEWLDQNKVERFKGNAYDMRLFNNSRFEYGQTNDTAAFVGRVAFSTTSYTVSSAGVETAYSYSASSHTLSQVGSGLTVHGWGVCAGAGVNTVAIQIGTTTAASFNPTASSTWHIVTKIMRKGGETALTLSRMSEASTTEVTSVTIGGLNFEEDIPLSFTLQNTASGATELLATEIFYTR